jgi:hypothetical protein
MVADAYKGDKIKETITDFLHAASGNKPETLKVAIKKQNVSLKIGSIADLIAYIGHNGLMDFSLDEEFHRNKSVTNIPDAIMLACYSKNYFSKHIQQSGATPLLWTTGFMAPEAYTLKSAIDGWILKESPKQIRTRAANAYHHYQKCKLDAAKRLFDSGW